jgi:hypothetical protein
MSATQSKLAADTLRQGFVALVRSPETEALMEDPHAFALLAYIARRARFTDSTAGGLSRGQMFMGRHSASRELGMKQGATREATKRLKAAKHIGVQATKRGSIVTLISSSVFDIGSIASNQVKDNSPTSKQPTDNQRPATNEEGRREEIKNVCEGAKPPPPAHTPSFLSEVQAEFADKDIADIWQRMLEHYAKKPEMLTKARLRTWCKTEFDAPDKNHGKSRGQNRRPNDGPPEWRETLIALFPELSAELIEKRWDDLDGQTKRTHFSQWEYNSKWGEWRQKLDPKFNTF